MITGLHHLTVLVRDLDAAIAPWSALLGPPVFEDLPARGVRTARFPLGTVWLVLAEPVDATGLPAQHLARHGEGVFVVSLTVPDLEATATRDLPAHGPPRAGLDGWSVQDLDPAAFNGVGLQLCRERPAEAPDPSR